MLLLDEPTNDIDVNACVRLDAHNVTYHIPLPEQPGGSYSHVAFTDRTQLSFSNTRDYPMVYTLDGSIPSAKSARYSKPLIFTDDATLNIATLMPSGKTSTVRTITIDRQQPSAGASGWRWRLWLCAAPAMCWQRCRWRRAWRRRTPPWRSSWPCTSACGGA